MINDRIRLSDGEPAAAINLAEGGFSDGDPGPAVAPPYREWSGWDLLVNQGQRVGTGELALFDAAVLLWVEMRNPYPQYGVI